MKKLAVLCVALLLSACLGTSQNAQFYMMKPVTSDQAPVSEKFKATVGVESVSIPYYLDKPQIILMNTDNVNLTQSEMNRWAEPLSIMMQRVITDDLSAYLPKATIKARNFSRENFDYIVLIEVTKMDAYLGDKVTLDAWVSILNKDGTTLTQKRVQDSEPAGSTYTAVVEAQSTLSGRLSDQIARLLIKVK